MDNTDTSIAVGSSVYEVPIRLKLSSKKVLYGVLMPLIILVLFYCVCCLEIMQKIGFQVAFKCSIPLMVVGFIRLFRHARKRTEGRAVNISY